MNLLCPWLLLPCRRRPSKTNPVVMLHQRRSTRDDNAAQAPWAWDDSNDGAVFVGHMLCDPAYLFDAYFDGYVAKEGFSHLYLSHIYRTHVIQISSVSSTKNRDPSSFLWWDLDPRSDIYVLVDAEDSPGSTKLIDANVWKKNRAEVGVIGIGAQASIANRSVDRECRVYWFVYTTVMTRAGSPISMIPILWKVSVFLKTRRRPFSSGDAKVTFSMDTFK